MPIQDHIVRDSDYAVIEEPVSAFLKRSGVVYDNRRGGLTVRMPSADPKQRAWGKVVGLGNVEIKLNVSKEELNNMIQSCRHPNTTFIRELFPTRFCCYDRCEVPMSFFVSSNNHTVCSRCGVVQKSVRSHMRRGGLTESGKINMKNLDFTPNMSVTDTSLRRKRKRGTSDDDFISVKKTKSHERTLYKRLKLINNITECRYFGGIEKITSAASYKMRKLYHLIHNEDSSDGTHKQWHGDALTAAACVYAAKLEFEEARHGIQTPLTLRVIQDTASQEVIKIDGRAVRDVTVLRIQRYTHRLKRWNLCSAKIPSINAQTVSMSPENASVEHSRISIQNKCDMVHVYVPTSGPLGLTIRDTDNGILTVDKLPSASAAYKAGVREGDYLFQIEKDTIETGQTPHGFVQSLIEWRKAHKDRDSMSLVVFRPRPTSN